MLRVGRLTSVQRVFRVLASLTLHSLERLVDVHQCILALAMRLTRAIDDPQTPAGELRDRAEALLGDLIPHLGIEDRDIYPRLVTGADDATVRAAREAIQRFEGTAADWRDYGSRWNAEAIAADRDGFAEATADLLAQLNARVRSGNELLYPLALQSSAIRLRA